MTYTEAVALAVASAVFLDMTVLGTRLVLRTAFWVSYGIMLFFQVIVNGLLTGLKIVRYDPAQILGPRIAFAPIEDLLFGFAMITFTLSLWVWVGRRKSAGRRAARAPRGADR